MKKIIALLFALASLSASAQTNTNIVIRYRPMVVDSNFALAFPDRESFKRTNNIASQTDVTSLWMTVQGANATNASNAAIQAATDLAQSTAISNNESISAVAHAGQMASFAASNVWAVTQTWDFVTGSNGTDWTYANGSLWVTNFGVKLNGPPFGYGATNQRVSWAQAQTAYAYRVTFVSKSGGWNPNGQIFIPSGVEYNFWVDQSNAVMTNVVIITNTAQIGWAHGNIYYSPNFIQSVTIESAAAPTNKVTVGGDFTPDVGGTWDLGSAAIPFDEVFARSGPWWKFANFNPASTATASNYTIAVGTTNVFFCLTNNWRGAGTNWARIPLSDY